MIPKDSNVPERSLINLKAPDVWVSTVVISQKLSMLLILYGETLIVIVRDHIYALQIPKDLSDKVFKRTVYFFRIEIGKIMVFEFSFIRDQLKPVLFNFYCLYRERRFTVKVFLYRCSRIQITVTGKMVRLLYYILILF